MPTTPTVSNPADLSRAADERLRQPLRRGSFRPLDAARAQLALLTVADGFGQARIYWLVDQDTKCIEEARFLAFGDLASHPVADLWCERARGTTVDAACSVSVESLEAGLRDDPATPAFGHHGLAPLAFVADLQERARAAARHLVVLPKPVEKEVYQRKREADWDDHDRAWLPLSLLKKIGRVQKAARRALERFDRANLDWELEGLHDDFRCVVVIKQVAAEEVPTLAKVIEDALRADVHPALRVEGRTDV